MVATLTVSSLAKSQETLHGKFVNEYKRYRKKLGCDAPLCDKTEELTMLQTTVETNQIFIYIDNSKCCSRCSCDKDCERIGNCCPDKIANFPGSSWYPLGGIYGCYLTSVKKKPEISQTYRKMIGRCALNYSNEDVIKQCESSNPNTLEQFARVTHKNTEEAYKNIFCARCNFIPDDELIFWNVSIRCTKGALLLKIMSTVIPQLLTSSVCNIVFQILKGYIPPPCTELVSKCNVTGKWTQHDPLVEYACSAYTAEYRHSWQSYKNIFCYVCNTENLLSPGCTDTEREEFIGEVPISFSALLDFTVPAAQKKTAPTCPESAMFDEYKGECKDIICPAMTDFSNGSCQRIVHSATGLCFKVYIRVTFSKHLFAKEMITSTHRFISNLFKHCKGRSIFSIDLECVFSGKQHGVHTSETCVAIDAEFSKDVDFIDTLIKLDHESVSLDYFNTSEIVTVEIVNINTDIDDSSEELVKQFVKPVKFSSFGVCSKTLIVSKFLHCTMLRLDQSDFQTKENRTEVILKHSGAILTADDFLRLSETEIQMCLDDYLSITEKAGESTKQLSLSQYTLGLVVPICISCSILCLVITIIVYLSFPILRTQPGINNLFLSSFLLLAYVCLLFGLFASISGIWCIIMGLLFHFLWLNSIFWMNVCSFHMFRSFGTMQVNSQKKATWQYKTYCLVLSAVLVTINIIWSEIKSKGESIGYGRSSSICYIVHSEMIACTMTSPVFVVISANVIMYIVVVYRTCRTPLVPRSTLKNRSYFFIYIKLSTITGIAWLSYIPVLITKNVILEILFTILVECHGIFIMLAFVCNRRVLNLLRKTAWKTKASYYLSTIRKTSIETMETSIQSSTDNRDGIRISAARGELSK